MTWALDFQFKVQNCVFKLIGVAMPMCVSFVKCNLTNG